MGTLSVMRNGQVATIHIEGRFDFRNQAQFRDAFRKELANKNSIPRFVIDLSKTEYIDSSALGVLLLLWEESGREEGHVELVNAKPNVRSILDSANFQRLFKVV